MTLANQYYSPNRAGELELKSSLKQKREIIEHYLNSLTKMSDQEIAEYLNGQGVEVSDSRTNHVAARILFKVKAIKVWESSRSKKY